MSEEKKEHHWSDHFPEVKVNILGLTGLVFWFLIEMSEFLPVQAIIGIGSGYMGALAVVVKDLVSSRKSSAPSVIIHQHYHGIDKEDSNE